MKRGFVKMKRGFVKIKEGRVNHQSALATLSCKLVGLSES
jgi:hypothetical protein